MSDNGIRVKVVNGKELEKRYYVPSKKELRVLFTELGFLPPDAEELSQAGYDAFFATPEGRLAVGYGIFYDENNLHLSFSKILLEEEGGNFYSNEKLKDDFPVTGLPPRYARTSDTALLTAGLENLLASYTMTERSFVFAVPHAGFALRNSDVLSRLLEEREIKKVVLAFPKSQAAYQRKLAKLLKQDGFSVEILNYEGKSPFEHYQLSISRMMEQAMEQLEQQEEVYNPAREA